MPNTSAGDYGVTGHKWVESSADSKTEGTASDQKPEETLGLLRSGAVERVRRGLRLAGVGFAVDAFLEEIGRHTRYVERCSAEAEAVLRGNLAAGNRLWLLLQKRVDAQLPLPASILGEGGYEVLRRTPTTLDGELLLRLIAGVVRAANQPSEAEIMLEVLGELLRPLFQLELVGAAIDRAGQGDTDMLETLVTAQLTPRWLVELTGTAGLVPVRDHPFQRGVSTKLDPNRVPFSRASWLRLDRLKGLDNWGLLWPCAGGVQLGASQIDRFGARYEIDSISPPTPCPGETLTILGSNFGPLGRVGFPAPPSSDPVFTSGVPADVLVGATPISWTDTRIEVVVPFWATAGQLHLDSFTTYVNPCLKLDVYRLGNSVLFQGGRSSIFQAFLNGVEIDLSGATTLSLPLDQALTITYRASGGPTTRVEVQVVAGGVLVEETNLPGGLGTVTFTLSSTVTQAPTAGSLIFTTTSNCLETAPLTIPVFVSVPPKLSIQYVEVTQGVQTDLPTVLAGQGMPTVANKDTIIRVHMFADRGLWFGNNLSNITGMLKVDGMTIPPLNSAAIGFSLTPDQTDTTLNFLIPAAYLAPGAHPLSVTVISNDPSGKITVGAAFSWTWFAKQPFRVRAVYMGPGGTDLEMLTYARNTMDYLPTDLSDIGIASRRNYIHDNSLSNRASWMSLVHKLEDAWDDEDEDSGVRWLGIVPDSEVPAGATVSGISGVPSIAVIAIESAPQTGAHELGHSYGLYHVNLPPAGPNEPGGPYDSVDHNGYLPRPAFDVRNNQAVPTGSGEIMSYFYPRGWSTTNWLSLFNNSGDS